MRDQRTKNLLLFVIATCLVLIVLKLFGSSDLMSRAQAQSPEVAATAVRLYGCSLLDDNAPGGCARWRPLRADTYEGRLLVTQH